MIDRVTITGADNLTSISFLEETQQKFPSTEWGILIHPTKYGAPRYPTYDWVETLPKELNLSLHVCSRFARNICQGFWEIPYNIDAFKRIQLNFSPYQKLINEKEFIECLKTQSQEFIFQIKKPNEFWIDLREKCLAENINVSFLYDASGGKGVYSKDWADPIGYCGYAGGFAPETLENQLKEIPKAEKIWIDVESNVRTNDILDESKVLLFLEKANAFR